ncbi:restriction endonuclease subunit S domain-containing protein [Paracoccus jeotgali]|uniref:Restriction endonuclease subunit S n=2 Tax=Alphaproteobacteria TaxID=28211 RepID=A0A2K9MEZ1_9RHOB|nr:restriction endonuclease subunit S [Paracoccus jeotgali]AUM73566.1 restriction endonuclease subunit S [Paracoccus jeotgali]
MWGSIAISDFLTKSESWVPVEPDGKYKQITARLWGKGLTLRGEVPGSAIAAARQYCAKAGQFLLSRIDARHGAYGIVPEELDGALVSNDFPCFDIDASRVMPHYFEWYSRTPEFIDLCRRASEGSTNRVRMKEDKFLRMMVPRPSLDEQRRIVEKLDRVAALVDERRNAIEAAERETQALLLKAFQRAIDGAPLRPMAEVAPLVRREVEIEATREYTEIGVRSFYNGIFHRRTMPGSEFSWQSLFWVKEGDLVFSNLMAWERAIAVAEAHDEGTVGNHRMLTCEVNPKLATPGFLMAYFRTYEGFSSIVGHSPGTIARNKTLSSKKLPTILVPTPPVETQKWFDRLQTKAHEARTIRANTAQDVEALIPAMLHETFGRQHQAA